MLLFFLERLNSSTEEPIYLAAWAHQERIRKKELSRQQIQRKKESYIESGAKETPEQKWKRQAEVRATIRLK